MAGCGEDARCGVVIVGTVQWIIVETVRGIVVVGRSVWEGDVGIGRG